MTYWTHLIKDKIKMTMKYIIMIKLQFTVLLLSLIYSPIFSQNINDPPEPKMKLDVIIDNEHFLINEGDTLRFDNKLITIYTSNYMTFNFGVLSFDYPRHFAYEFEQDFAYKNWTLDGNNFVIMYFELGAKVELESFIVEMVKKFGRKNCIVTDKQLKLGDIDFIGKRIDVNLIGTKITYDMYLVPSNDYKTHFIAFQDSKNEDGSDSLEGLGTIDIINKTIKLK